MYMYIVHIYCVYVLYYMYMTVQALCSRCRTRASRPWMKQVSDVNNDSCPIKHRPRRSSKNRQPLYSFG